MLVSKPLQIPSSQTLDVLVGGYSTAGRKEHNDDAFAAHIPVDASVRHLKGVTGCLSDGISTSKNSHLASQTTVLQFTDDYYSAPETWATPDAAARSLNALNRWLAAQSQGTDDQQRQGWIATFSAVILKGHSAHIFHVGDCRVYLVRKGEVRCLTLDHIHKIAGGETLLTGALGVDANLRVDYQERQIEPDDIFLIMSDGVYSSIANVILADFLNGRALNETSDLETASKDLCTAAYNAGSDDNLSCLMMKVNALPRESIDDAHLRLTHKKIPPRLSVGNKIDNFEVERVLHSGTRSHVYLVRDQNDKQRYVLKAPSRNFEDDLNYLELFAREQWVGQRFTDPGLMKVIPAGKDSPFLYAVLEHIEGPTLRQWMLDNPRPSLTAVREIICQLIRVVRVLHRAGMVHRDIKPENIIIPEQRGLVLIDFGTIKIAGLQEAAVPGQEAETPQGSVDYIAPETLLGRPATGASDLFSIGAITYELLTGTPPYKLDPSGTRWPKSYDGWVYRPVRYLRDDVPDWVDHALEKCCAADPAKRYKAMSEFEVDLKRPGRMALARQSQVALKDRDPLLFWKCVSIALAAIAILQFFLLVNG